MLSARFKVRVPLPPAIKQPKMVPQWSCAEQGSRFCSSMETAMPSL